MGVAATGGKLHSSATGATPIPPALPAGKGEAGLVLPQFSIPALPISPFFIAGIALALAPHPWRGKLPGSPKSLWRKGICSPWSTGMTRAGDTLHKLRNYLVRIIAIEVCWQLKSGKQMSRRSTVPYCVATILL